MARIRVGIVGGTGYTGAELLRLLLPHPDVEVRWLTSRQEAGRRADSQFPQLRGRCELAYSLPDVDSLSQCDAVFFATPHGAAMGLAPALLARGVRVIDLSADFRLRDPAAFSKWYGIEHSAPGVLAEAVYGLPEVHRAAIQQARLVACPGCYPTAVQLGLIPLLEAGLINPSRLIADCKSCVSGAGREVRMASLYCEVADSFKAYGVSGHRHLPEIEQGLRQSGGGVAIGLTFVPHLVPMNRGIHATLYAELENSSADVQAVFEARYRQEAFVQILPPGDTPDTRSVRGSNVCRIAIHRLAGDRLVILSVIDNLVKGAAGQALQCFNLMFGLAETTGLDLPALSP